MIAPKPVYEVVETEELAEALESARILWPELSDDDTKLVEQILDVGSRHLIRDVAVRRTAGSMSDIWPANWISEIKNDWPS